MYSIKAEQSFDSAHFLANYKGKCKNIHGHRWKLEIEVQSEVLSPQGQLGGMIVDFGDLKKDIKSIVDEYDHELIIERGSMREETLRCLREDGFSIVEVGFRPTAENFAAFFYKLIKDKGYKVKRATIHETPTNCASYEESRVI